MDAPGQTDFDRETAAARREAHGTRCGGDQTCGIRRGGECDAGVCHQFDQHLQSRRGGDHLPQRHRRPERGRHRDDSARPGVEGAFGKRAPRRRRRPCPRLPAAPAPEPAPGPAPAEMAPQPDYTTGAYPADRPTARMRPSTTHWRLMARGLTLTGYGPCWQPTVVIVNPGWQPYCDGGRWVYTDCGWYWLSGYSWGWAPFHYGRWFHHHHLGWCWQPGNAWGPSWVCWRYGGNYCGWAPLPPAAGFNAGVGLTYHGQRVNSGFGFGLERQFLYVCACQPFLRPPPEPLRSATPTGGADLQPDSAFRHDRRQQHAGRQPRHPGVTGGSGYRIRKSPGSASAK